jgi:hypothetical protein
VEKPANSLIRMPQNALKALLEDVPTRVSRSLMFIVLTIMSVRLFLGMSLIDEFRSLLSWAAIVCTRQVSRTAPMGR